VASALDTCHIRSSTAVDVRPYPHFIHIFDSRNQIQFNMLVSNPGNTLLDNPALPLWIWAEQIAPNLGADSATPIIRRLIVTFKR
jgi:hypothetical protein